MLKRRRAILQFAQFHAASPLLTGDHKFSEVSDPLLAPANVFDFAKLAKAKLDPLAWDYLDEGSDDETSLRANRSRFDNLIIRPHFLLNDVASIDTSVSLFGKSLLQPFYLSVTGGKNCFVPNGEQETAMAAGTANAMMITNGGISDVLSPLVKGPSLVAVHDRGRVPQQDPDGGIRKQGRGPGLLGDLRHGGHLCRIASRTQHA